MGFDAGVVGVGSVVVGFAVVGSAVVGFAVVEGTSSVGMLKMESRADPVMLVVAAAAAPNRRYLRIL